MKLKHISIYIRDSVRVNKMKKPFIFRKQKCLKTNLVGILILFFVPVLITNAQDFRIRGTIYDSITREPLAFANIVYNSEQTGTVSSLDGHFSIPSNKAFNTLHISLVGYKTKTITVYPKQNLTSLKVYLLPVSYPLEEVIIYPGVNPAHRIINKVIEKAPENDPEKLKSYSCISYNKMYFSLEDTISGKRYLASDDSISKYIVENPELNPKKKKEESYILFMESISEKKFKAPDKNKETVITSRVSGLKNPSFLLIASQFQSFSFYGEKVKLADNLYLNPISEKGLKQYFFLLKDTFYTPTLDTVFIISFKPARGKNFSGLKGTIYINTHNYAIQNVIAEIQEDRTKPVFIRIQQSYSITEKNQWFPVELKTELIFNNLSYNTVYGPKRMKAEGKSYLMNIHINPELDDHQFDGVVMHTKESLSNDADTVISKYRLTDLTEKELSTYQLVDSIGDAKNFDLIFSNLETFLEGYLSVGVFNLDLSRIIDFNSYEGFRLGIGGITNRKFSETIELGGHFAYGFRDKEIKYGGHIDFKYGKHKLNHIGYSYLNDLNESGSYSFLENIPVYSTEYYRQYLLENLDEIEEHKIFTGFSLWNYLQLELYGRQYVCSATNAYSFLISNENPVVGLQGFQSTEVGFQARYLYKEQFMQTPSGNIWSLGSNYPALYFNYTKGLHLLDGNYTYDKVELQLRYRKDMLNYGMSYFTLAGGNVWGKVPYSLIYSGRGSYKILGIETSNSFSTMRFNEFLSSRFLYFFFEHKLKNKIRISKKIKPDIRLVNHTGFGWLEHKELHKNIEFKTMEKGYFECGILFSNMVRQKIFGYGLGFFYRYGPYAFSKEIDNFAVTMTLDFLF